jgi:hypothetical protein
MPLSTRRLIAGVLTGLAAGAATVVAAPAALAAPAPLPTPVLSATTVVPGQPFTLTLSGCLDQPGRPLPGVFYMDAGDREHFGNGAQVLPDGSYTFTEQFQPGNALGDYPIQAVCDRYDSDQAYPVVTVTLVATLPSTPPEDTDPGKGHGNGKGHGHGHGHGNGIGQGPGASQGPAVRPAPRSATDVRGIRPS